MSGHAEFTHDVDVERKMERVRYFISDGDAAARQCEYECVRVACIVVQMLGKLLPGIGAVA
jgi:hypothetical protein